MCDRLDEYVELLRAENFQLRTRLAALEGKISELEDSGSSFGWILTSLAGGIFLRNSPLALWFFGMASLQVRDLKVFYAKILF